MNIAARYCRCARHVESIVVHAGRRSTIVEFDHKQGSGGKTGVPVNCDYADRVAGATAPEFASYPLWFLCRRASLLRQH